MKKIINPCFCYYYYYKKKKSRRRLTLSSQPSNCVRSLAPPNVQWGAEESIRCRLRSEEEENRTTQSPSSNPSHTPTRTSHATFHQGGTRASAENVIVAVEAEAVAGIGVLIIPAIAMGTTATAGLRRRAFRGRSLKMKLLNIWLGRLRKRY